MKPILLAVLSLVAGAATVVQSRLNGEIGGLIHNGLLVAWLSFSVSLGGVLLVMALFPGQRRALKRALDALRKDQDGHRKLRWWQLLGGIGGATYVTSQGVSVPALGVAIFTVAVVAGQNINSLLVDRLGFGPAGPQPITAARAMAAVVATIGVGIAVSGQIDSPAFSLSALVLALVSGALVAGQQAVNARVGNAGGSPWVAALANFWVGWSAIGLAIVIQLFVAHRGGGWWPPVWFHPWMLTGGLIGLFFIVVAAAAVARLGVLIFALLAIAGQVAAALLLALVWPTTAAAVDSALIFGVLLTGMAVAVAAWAKPIQA